MGQAWLSQTVFAEAFPAISDRNTPKNRFEKRGAPLPPLTPNGCAAIPEEERRGGFCPGMFAAI
jgi:hypothetical protein